MQEVETQPIVSSAKSKKIDFGLIFFSSNERPDEPDKYRLVLESAKFADQHDFSSIWIPERHFTQEGSLYPNPAILQAALAIQTKRIQLRAGSVVLPLHNPIQIAEEWAMIDNLSGGRVGISFASGWHPNDFVLNPDNYSQRSMAMYAGIETVRKLWRGETIVSRAGDNQMAQIRTYPSPLQRELPFWITAAGNPKTFATAGEMGANLLTHLYNQSIEELTEKIQIYRHARAQHGYDPTTGQVSVMMHTFVGADEEMVRAQIQGPFCAYLRSATHLLDAIAHSRGQKVDLSTLSPQEIDEYLFFVFERLVSNQRVLFGTPESCLNLVMQLQNSGVNEIACQMDFGIETDLVLNSLPYLIHLKEQAHTLTSRYEQSDKIVTEKSPSIKPISLLTTQSSSQISTPVLPVSELVLIQQRCQEYLPPAQLYQYLEQYGMQLSGTYQAIHGIWSTTNEALGIIDTSGRENEMDPQYHLPPALFDTCCLLLLAALPSSQLSKANLCYLPSGMNDLHMYQAAPQRLWSHAKLISQATKEGEKIITGDVTLYTDNGIRIADIHGLQFRGIEVAATLSRPTNPESTLTDLLYSLQWEETILLKQTVAPKEYQVTTWLIFTDQQGVGTQLATRLQTRGDRCILVTQGDTFAHLLPDHYQIQANSATDIQSLFAEQNVNHFDHCIHLWSLDLSSQATLTADELFSSQETNLGSALHIIQAISLQESAHPSKLWLVTRGAQPITSDDPIPAIAQASLWGLGKTCAMEYPELWGGLIDLDPHATPASSAEYLFEHIHPAQQENQLAVRSNHSYVARLVHTAPLPSVPPFKIHKDGSYLITGGLHGLGLTVAHWLLDKGACYLILLGRTQFQSSENGTKVLSSELHEAALKKLEKRDARVHYISVDIADTDQLQTAFTDLNALGFPPLRGILHAASVWQDTQNQPLVRPLASISTRNLYEVLRPKVSGAWNLMQMLKHLPLDFFVSFSSGASLLGSASQGNYAAAGEFLDVLATYQRMQGHSALSIDWGAIADVGFGATPEGQHIHAYWEGRGIQRFPSHVVLAALEYLIPQSINRIGVMKMDWAQLAQSYPHLATLPLISRLIDTQSDADKRQKNPLVAQTLQQILTASPQQRYQLILDHLRSQVASVLQLPQDQVDPEQSLATFGLDSLMSLELKHQLDFQFDIHIPVVTLLQGPSIAQLTIHIVKQLAEKEHVLPATITNNPQTVTTAMPLIQQEQEDLLLKIEQHSQQNVGELVQNLLATTQQSAVESPTQQQAPSLDQLTDEQIELLLQQIVLGGDRLDSR